MQKTKKNRLQFEAKLGRIVLLVASLLVLSTVACKSNNLKPVKNLTYIPYDKGFGYKKIGVPSKGFKKWASVNKKKLDDNIGGLEEGFHFVVVGHTDKCGPDVAEGSKKGNDWYALQRAKNVRRALIQLGYPSKKLQAISLASNRSKGRSGCEPYNRDRQVTFAIKKLADAK